MSRGLLMRGLTLAATVLCVLGAPDRTSAQRPSAEPPRGESLAPGSFLGLRQAVELALRVHPLLQEADATLVAADARTEQARSLYYPQVSANIDNSFGAGRINPRFLVGGALLQQNQSIFVSGVLANQRIYDFGFTKNLVESSEQAKRAQEEDITARRALVVLAVERAYFTSQKRRRLVQIAEETVRERGVIKSQIEALYRQQLKSKLDLDLVQVELTNAEALLVRARNDLKASFADLNRAMGITGPEDYVLDDFPVEIRQPRPLDSLIAESLSHPELKKAKEIVESAEAKVRAMKKQYLPTISAVASGGSFDPYDPRQHQEHGGWWAAGALMSMPLFTGFLIENQVREASAQQDAARATSLNIEQALAQQVTTSYLETLSLAQQIKLAEEQVRTAREALQLARQRYKLGLGSVVEVTQSEVALTAAQTRLAEAQYDYKIAEVTLAYATGALTGPP
ncbi:TolC family protein [Nitrospira sp. Kam-Ns4a]